MTTYDEAMEAMRNMGRASRFHRRMVARECGLKELPGMRVIIDGVEVIGTPEKLDEWLTGEQEYIAAWVLNKAAIKAGYSKP